MPLHRETASVYLESTSTPALSGALHAQVKLSLQLNFVNRDTVHHEVSWGIVGAYQLSSSSEKYYLGAGGPDPFPRDSMNTLTPIYPIKILSETLHKYDPPES